MKMKSTDAILLVIDVQTKLIDTIAEKNGLLKNLEAIIKALTVLRVPILATQQDKLGEIKQEVSTLLGDVQTFRKLTFSSCRAPEFKAKMDELNRKWMLVCGIETHICVMQTVLDLLELGKNVLVARDATSSYDVADRETALERMRDAGAKITTTESAIYELIGEAGTPEFRQILPIIKELRRFRAAGKAKN